MIGVCLRRLIGFWLIIVLIFCLRPLPVQKIFFLNEGINAEKVFVVGNTVVDVF